jgi:hypothetical protein
MVASQLIFKAEQGRLGLVEARWPSEETSLRRAYPTAGVRRLARKEDSAETDLGVQLWNSVEVVAYLADLTPTR